MYTIPEVLATIETNQWVMICTVIGWIGGSVQFLEAIRLTWRDKVIGLPLGYVFAIVAHDSNVALNHDLWFNTVHHWYFETTWYMYPFWVLVEITVIIWFVRLARAEVAPHLPAPAFYAICAAFQIMAFILFHFTESLIADPLGIVGLAISQIVNVVFMIPLLLRRRSTRGQSRILGWAILLGPGSIGLLQSAAMVPALRTPLYYAMVACMTALSIGYLILLEYYRQREKAALVGT